MQKGIKLDRNKHGEYNLWQKRFWEYTIKNEKDLTNHIDYIHYHPVSRN